MITTQWLEDIDFIRQELPKRHKNLFFLKDRKEFYEDIENLNSSIVYMDNYEITVAISKIIASIHDAHTFITLPVSLMLPIKLYWFKEGLYVTEAVDEYSELKFCRIKDINGTCINEIIRVLSSIISYENEAYLKSQLPKYLPAVELLYGLEIIDDIEEVTITFEAPEGRIFEMNIKPMPLKDLTKKFLTQPLSEDVLPLYRQNNDQYYWFKYLECSKILYFKYNSCRNMEHLNVENFAKEVLEFIENNKPEKLIIDMRNNFGGNSMLLDSFIDNISTFTNINSPERLFVVVGRETFSSALLNVYSFKEKTAAKFIGETSGGKPNCYGEVERFSLKNSKLTISYSTEYFQVVEDDFLESFVPDVLIEPSIKDFVNGTDPVLDYIMNSSKIETH
jgi:hypothetical protein